MDKLKKAEDAKAIKMKAVPKKKGEAASVKSTASSVSMSISAWEASPWPSSTKKQQKVM